MSETTVARDRITEAFEADRERGVKHMRLVPMVATVDTGQHGVIEERLSQAKAALQALVDALDGAIGVSPATCPLGPDAYHWLLDGQTLANMTIGQLDMHLLCSVEGCEQIAEWLEPHRMETRYCRDCRQAHETVLMEGR